ncbi:unnamed protein product [Arctia plantaginis]|uniref:Uncharacterized protein n=1 Tax=Arctia plantaginis TaxID=874455 RepID=A0A8S0Z4R6_ARCPL|nr:unnamed protein product [Arctia plantaginis]CAB3228358.1 unnamed protein product [Arctia plantaginis]
MDSNNNGGKAKTSLSLAEKSDSSDNKLDKENSSETVSNTIRMKNDSSSFPKKDTFSNIFLLICIMGVSFGILLEIINIAKRNQKYSEENCNERPKYWSYAKHADVENRNGLLQHVHSVLERVGYEKGSNKSSWDLLWAHDSPFTSLHDTLLKLKPHQRVNHYPGTGYLTTKVYLATINSKYIPKAFKLPKSKEDFFKYAEENKDSLFLVKLNTHRGVHLKNVSEINVSDENSFVQEYIQKPFLVDGHKFDIGVYVVITSVNPLRAYWFAGDVLFRYCPSKYYPFDPNDLDKYVIRDKYLPTWEVPSLAMPFSALGHGMKDVFDIYARSKGKDPTLMWEEVRRAIAEILIMKEHHIISATKRYPSQDNFFEMMRFDLIVDENLKVYVLEANMSPNLNSASFKKNALIYEPLLYNLFSLTGISRQIKSNDANPSDKSAAKDMISSYKNIAVFGDQCATICKDDCNVLPQCNLCKPCLGNELKNSLLKAHAEFLHRGDFRRLVPLPMSQVKDINEFEKSVPEGLQGVNKLQHMWYQEKCNQDIAWCT